jgi:hypothetical protein
MTTTPTIMEAVRDPDIFAKSFKKPATWGAWFSFLRVLFGLRLSAADLSTFQECTGRTDRPPSGGFNEAWLCVGRRGGKSNVLALIAVYLAAFRDWTPFLSPGERGTIMVIAADRKQARTIFRYIVALLHDAPKLNALIERETADSIDLVNQITIEISTASFRTTRGYSVVAALCDEIAYWRSDDSANPDKEIVAAIRPTQATIPGAMLFGVSSPYARRGVLWDASVRHHGKNGDPVLFWKAATRVMNPAVPQRIIDEAYADDAAMAAADYGAEFRSDVETYISREVLEACTVKDRFELPPVADTRYVAFVDPSGGASDSMTMAICHRDPWSNKTVLDLIREFVPPFSPEQVVAELCATLKMYRVKSLHGDRYAGLWPRERFALGDVTYIPSEKTKSDLYLECLPLLNSNQVELLALPKLFGQFALLERQVARGGRESIDHPRGSFHDDIANAVAGCLVFANQRDLSTRILLVGVPTRSGNPDQFLSNVEDNIASLGGYD